MDRITEAINAPRLTMRTSRVMPKWKSPTLKIMVYPIKKLARPQRAFTSGGDRPRPGGEAKGLGNLFPDMPCTKWGTPLARKKPAKI